MVLSLTLREYMNSVAVPVYQAQFENKMNELVEGHMKKSFRPLPDDPHEQSQSKLAASKQLIQQITAKVAHATEECKKQPKDPALRQTLQKYKAELKELQKALEQEQKLQPPPAWVRACRGAFDSDVMASKIKDGVAMDAFSLLKVIQYHMRLFEPLIGSAQQAKSVLATLLQSLQDRNLRAHDYHPTERESLQALSHMQQLLTVFDLRAAGLEKEQQLIEQAAGAANVPATVTLELKSHDADRALLSLAMVELVELVKDGCGEIDILHRSIKYSESFRQGADFKDREKWVNTSGKQLLFTIYQARNWLYHRTEYAVCVKGVVESMGKLLEKLLPGSKWAWTGLVGERTVSVEVRPERQTGSHR